ncbi:DUF6259 domain-containing protein [uncultured Desulfobacter sp.]|uniref:DUF6259 domain-containing protein n=1 Tax=uncultured Desulfobacter sp. TaxID=240139 RepID=UPI002AA8B136|nr:DUF6259 domain-containing protein [uncultured Desulfobacter sp.]
MITKSNSFKFNTIILYCLLCINSVVLGLSQVVDAQEIKLLSKSSLLTLNNDLKSIKSYSDRKRNQFISARSVPLYQISFGHDYNPSRKITTYDAVNCRILRKGESFIEIEYQHPENKLTVICNIRTNKKDSLHYWNIKVKNNSQDIITQIQYPQVACKTELGQKLNRDSFVFPVHEGALLTGLNKKGAGIKERYPGILSSQMMYNFDIDGGLFYAALDGSGYSKNICAINKESSILMAQEFVLPIQATNSITQPYEVATGLFGGRWEDGAAVYRNWSDTQIWAEKRISKRSMPEWLKKPNLFVNFLVPGDTTSVGKLYSLINKYHSFFDIPIIAIIFGWEKNGDWIGPDYFPPRPNQIFYEKLSKLLQQNGDHLHFYSSGFRFGVRKPIQSNEGARTYSHYNGLDYFNKFGKHLAVSKPNGTFILKKRKWADNYLICAGLEESRTQLAQCYDKIYEMGIAGIDLDQNIGGFFEDCFNPVHSHPPGAGLWKTKAMEEFLNSIIAIKKKRGEQNFFQGVEEPCERFAHLFDIYHGRAFTDIKWPVRGPGAVSIPLYLFLYHEYQLGYAGCIGKGFSPSGDIRNGIGRSFIFGMMPGIRSYGPTKLKAPITEELLMLKSYIELMKEIPQYVLHGRMIGEASILNVFPFEHLRPVPVQWSSVQGIVWQLPENKNKVILLANLSKFKQTVWVNMKDLFSDKLKKIGSANGMGVTQQAILQTGGFASVELNPWELAAILE